MAGRTVSRTAFDSLVHSGVERFGDVRQTEMQNAVLRVALLVEVSLLVPSRRQRVLVVRENDVRGIGVARLAEFRNGTLRRTLPVVAVIAPLVELIALQVDLYDPALEVIKVSALYQQSLRFLPRHRLRVVVHEAHALRLARVVKRRQHVRLVQTFQTNYDRTPFWIYTTFLPDNPTSRFLGCIS